MSHLCNNIEFIDEPELKPAEYISGMGFLINNTVRAIGAPLGCGTDFYRFQPSQHIWCQCRRIEPPSQQQQKNHNKTRTKVKNEMNTALNFHVQVYMFMYQGFFNVHNIYVAHA